MFAGDDGEVPLPGDIKDNPSGEDAMRSEGVKTHPNDYITEDGKFDGEALLDRMQSEEDAMRLYMAKRREESIRIANEIDTVVSALRAHGYDSDQINHIFSSGMLTTEVIDELVAEQLSGIGGH